MDTDIHKQRRNLIGMSLGLFVFELSNGKSDSVSILGGGIKLQDGQNIIILAYIALIYLTWRYWLYTKPQHKEFQKIVNARILSSKLYKACISERVTSFENKIGSKAYNPTPTNHFVVNKIFRRQLHIYTDSLIPEPSIGKEIHEIPYIAYEAMRAKAYLSAIADDKTFSDLFVPYVLCIAAIATALFRVFYA